MHYLSRRQIVNVIIIICSRHSLCYILSDGSLENHLAADFEGLVFEIYISFNVRWQKNSWQNLTTWWWQFSMTMMACFLFAMQGFVQAKQENSVKPLLDSLACLRNIPFQYWSTVLCWSLPMCLEWGNFLLVFFNPLHFHRRWYQLSTQILGIRLFTSVLRFLS